MKQHIRNVFAAILIAATVISMINVWTTARYIRETERRDTAQEQCITDQAKWLQDWLKWRWVDNIDATGDQIKDYHRVHPQPACQIR